MTDEHGAGAERAPERIWIDPQGLFSAMSKNVRLRWPLYGAEEERVPDAVEYVRVDVADLSRAPAVSDDLRICMDAEQAILDGNLSEEHSRAPALAEECERLSVPDGLRDRVGVLREWLKLRDDLPAYPYQVVTECADFLAALQTSNGDRT